MCNKYDSDSSSNSINQTYLLYSHRAISTLYPHKFSPVLSDLSQNTQASRKNCYWEERVCNSHCGRTDVIDVWSFLLPCFPGHPLESSFNSKTRGYSTMVMFWTQLMLPASCSQSTPFPEPRAQASKKNSQQTSSTTGHRAEHLATDTGLTRVSTLTLHSAFPSISLFPSEGTTALRIAHIPYKQTRGQQVLIFHGARVCSPPCTSCAQPQFSGSTKLWTNKNNNSRMQKKILTADSRWADTDPRRGFTCLYSGHQSTPETNMLQLLLPSSRFSCALRDEYGIWLHCKSDLFWTASITQPYLGQLDVSCSNFLLFHKLSVWQTASRVAPGPCPSIFSHGTGKAKSQELNSDNSATCCTATALSTVVHWPTSMRWCFLLPFTYLYVYEQWGRLWLRLPYWRYKGNR